MTEPIQFRTSMEFAYGVPRELAPGVVRLVANNPSPFTYKGTNTYIVGQGREIMLIDPGPADATHLAAILRTIGASQGSIMRIFLITGAAIGVVGTLTGFLVGMLICLNIESIRQFLSWMTNTELFSPELYFLSRLPAEVDFGETTAVVIMALTLSFLATLYQSWRAARLDPVDALRYE